jgi:hypothetical protein
MTGSGHGEGLRRDRHLAIWARLRDLFMTYPSENRDP